MIRQRKTSRSPIFSSWDLSAQEVGLVWLALGIFALGSLVQLYLVSRIALTGREVFMLQSQAETLRLQNEALQLQLAEMSAYDVMAARAAARGYQIVPPEQRLYVYVDGYSPPDPLNQVSLPVQVSHNSALPSAYTQSLLDWVFEKLNAWMFFAGAH